jgi:protoporphyrinogen/coproporphyrinogen III oxidase
MKTVAIIGGGITGLTAAFRLKQKNIPVTIYEAGARVGGVIQSTRQKGYLAEFGPNSILETSPKVTALVRDLDLEKRKLYTDPTAESRYIVRNGKPVLMADSGLGFLMSPLFSARAKARLFLEPFIRRAPACCEENLEQFVLRRLGREFLDYAINPFVAGVYAGNPARLSVKQAFPKLHGLEQKYGSLLVGQFFGARERRKRGEVSKQSAKKFSFDEGLQVLTDQLTEKLCDEISLQSPVTGIKQTSDGWIVKYQLAGHEEKREHEAVLFAVPTHKLADIKFETAHDFNFGAFEKIEYPPVTSIVFGFRREDVAHPCQGFGALIPEVEKFNTLGVIFSSALFPNRTPKDHVTLTCYVGGSRNPRLALADKSTLRRLVLEDLKKLLGVKGEPTFEHYFVYRKAIPQYEVGYGKMKNLMTEIESRATGFFMAGHYRDGIALSDSIVSGDNAADKIAKYLFEHHISQKLNHLAAA